MENPHMKKIEDIQQRMKELKKNLKSAKDNDKKNIEMGLRNLESDLDVQLTLSSGFEKEHTTEIVAKVDAIEKEVKEAAPTMNTKDIKAQLKSASADAKEAIKRITAIKKLLK